MSFIYSYQEYCTNKLLKYELKLNELDEKYREYCNEIDEAQDGYNKFVMYDELITQPKYRKLMKKINSYQIELNLIQNIIKSINMEPMHAHMELMVQ